MEPAAIGSRRMEAAAARGRSGPSPRRGSSSSRRSSCSGRWPGSSPNRASSSATTRRPSGCSWVDFNGYHALAGLLLFGPAFYFALTPKWALYYAIYAAGALFVTGIWALFEQQPAWVFTFPNNTTDAIFHLVGGASSPPSPLIQIGRDRR